MDPNRFDALVRTLAVPGSRRGALRVLTALPLLGGLVAFLDDDDVDAKGRRKRRVKAHKHGKGRRRKHRKSNCKAHSTAKTCAGKCGPVKNNCKKTVDCGSCACDPPCEICQTCDVSTGQCGTADNGTACDEGRQCQDGQCVCTADCTGKACGDDGCGGNCGTCPTGQTCCADRCVTGNCCGDADCDAHAHCAQNSCACDPGFHACAGTCVRDDDVATCGTSCQPCPSSLCSPATCDGRQCGRAPIPDCCASDGDCGDDQPCTTDTCDPTTHTCTHANEPITTSCGNGGNCCGGTCCTAPAHATPTCASGICGFQCDAGFHNCNGQCVSNNDVATCGNACSPCPSGPHSTATCAGGTCGVQCDAGWANCNGIAGDGCEADLTSDATCGSCGNQCRADQRCVGGSCVCSPRTQCPAGQTCGTAPDGCGGTIPCTGCPGCCDGTTCRTDNDNAACGTGGVPCQMCAACHACVNQTCVAQDLVCCGDAAVCTGGTCTNCADGQRCENGSCVCDATRCANGCCNGTTCVPFAQQTTLVCGTGGAACHPCTGTDTCGGSGTEGVCGCTPNCTGKCNGENDGCGGTCACPTGQDCVNGACLAGQGTCPAGADFCTSDATTCNSNGNCICAVSTEGNTICSSIVAPPGENLCGICQTSQDCVTAFPSVPGIFCLRTNGVGSQCCSGEPEDGLCALRCPSA